MKNSGENIFSRYAGFFSLVAVMCGSTSAIFSNLTSASSMTIGLVRLTIALPFFVIPFLFDKERRREMKNTDKKTLMLCVLSGITLACHFFSWFNAVRYTDVASAAVIGSLHPVIVLVIMCVFFKKRVSIKAVLAILAALAGGAVVCGFDFTGMAVGELKGNLLSLSAAACFGIYFIFGDFCRKKMSAANYVMTVFAACWVCFIAGVIISGSRVFGLAPEDYFYMIMMALVCQIGAHALFNVCLGHVSSIYMSAVNTLDPVFTTVLGVIFLGQIPGPSEIAGCIIVVAALMLFNYFDEQQR